MERRATAHRRAETSCLALPRARPAPVADPASCSTDAAGRIRHAPPMAGPCAATMSGLPKAMNDAKMRSLASAANLTRDEGSMKPMLPLKSAPLE